VPRKKSSARTKRAMRSARTMRPARGSRNTQAGRIGGMTVADRIAVEDLLARYAWALDTGDVDGFVACFTPDAVVIEEVFEEPDRWEGHANLRRLAEHYKSVPDFPGRQHHVSQVLAQGDARRCAVRSFTFVTECRGEPPYILRFAGYYEDEAVKVRGEWLFKQRTIRLWDGPVLARFPGRNGTTRIPRKRPPQLIIARS
jgi:SnoaL-like domain